MWICKNPRCSATKKDRENQLFEVDGWQSVTRWETETGTFQIRADNSTENFDIDDASDGDSEITDDGFDEGSPVTCHTCNNQAIDVTQEEYNRFIGITPTTNKLDELQKRLGI